MLKRPYRNNKTYKLNEQRREDVKMRRALRAAERARLAEEEKREKAAEDVRPLILLEEPQDEGI